MIDNPAVGLAALAVASLACSAFCQACVAKRSPGPVRSASATLLLAIHFASPLVFDTTTGTCMCALLAAALFGWWGSMRVLACVLSGTGALVDCADRSYAVFYAAYFLPVTLAPAGGKGDSSKGSGTDADQDDAPDGGTPSPRVLLFRFCFKVLLMFAVLAALDPYDNGTAPHRFLERGQLLGDALWSVTVLLSASGLMDFSGAAAGLTLGLPVRDAFRSPLFAVSLCDFWGRRWNLTAVRLLRDCCYRPLRAVHAPRALAMLSTFAVSGLAHEIIFMYGSGERYDRRVAGRWCAFFVAQGGLCAAEVALGLARGPAHRRPSEGGGALAALELGLRRLVCVSIVLACARSLFLAPAYAVGWADQTSHTMLFLPRLLLTALGLDVPLAAGGR